MKPTKLSSQLTADSCSDSLESSLDYRLYCLGWNHCLHSNPHPIVRALMSLSYLYRRGFKEASRWAASERTDDARQ